MLNRDKALICVTVVACIGLYAWRCGLANDASAAEYAAALAMVAPSVELGDLKREHSRLIESAVKTSAPLPTSRQSTADHPEPSKPPPDTRVPQEKFPRTRFDLVSYFMTGNVSVAGLARHADLNNDDRALLNAQIVELRAIVDHFNGIVSPLIDNHKRLQSREMIDIISTGKLRAANLPSVTEAQMYKMCDDILKRDKSTTMSREDLLRQMKANPPPAIPKDTGYVMMDGRCYLHEQFHSLPHADAVFAELKNLIIDFLGTVVAWFEMQGLCTASRLPAVLARAHEYSAAKARIRR